MSKRIEMPLRETACSTSEYIELFMFLLRRTKLSKKWYDTRYQRKMTINNQGHDDQGIQCIIFFSTSNSLFIYIALHVLAHVFEPFSDLE